MSNDHGYFFFFTFGQGKLNLITFFAIFQHARSRFLTMTRRHRFRKATFASFRIKRGLFLTWIWSTKKENSFLLLFLTFLRMIVDLYVLPCAQPYRNSVFAFEHSSSLIFFLYFFRLQTSFDS